MTFTIDRLRRAPTAMLAGTLMIVTAMIGWYGGMTIHRHHEQFVQETELYQKAVRFQSDRIILRIKDATAFIASGIDDRISDKVNSPTYRSPYAKQFGFFQASDPGKARRILGDEPLLDISRTADLSKLMNVLKRSESWVTLIRPTDWDGLFPSIPAGQVVMMQALRSSRIGADYNVVYAVVDLRAIVRDAAAPMQHGLLKSVDFVRGAADTGYRFETPQSWLNTIFPLTEQRIDIDVTRNIKLIATLRENYSSLRDLFTMLAGLVAITILSTGLVVVHWRMGRAARHSLSSALEEVRQASDAKSAFLANMSHEIRTPLNGVLGMAELLRRSELTQTQRHFADQIHSSGSVLLAILNDVLDLSKIESGQLAIDPVRTRLPSLLGEIVSFHAATAHAKNLELLVDIDPNLPEQVEVDPTRLRQILGNLISNALKFTREGEVVVAARRCDDRSDPARCRVEFTVKDTGIGISKDCIERLFSRFMQAQTSTTRLYGGTGLGLSICKEICELMGGSIGVVSALGQGSTFTFTLGFDVLEGPEEPSEESVRIAFISQSQSLKRILRENLPAYGIECLCFEPTADIDDRLLASHETLGAFSLLVVDEGNHISQAVKVCQLLEERAELRDLPTIVLGKQQVSASYQKFDKVVIKPFDTRGLAETILRVAEASELNGPFAPARPQEETPALPSHHGRRALLVDDNNVNLLFGGEVLGGLGFDVVMASDGQKAIEVAKEGSFDVILMDCQMPVMDGYETTGILRGMMETGEIPRTPIVAVTANAFKGDRERCLAAGMDAFVTKPMSISALETALDLVMDAPDARPGPVEPRAAPAPVARAAAPRLVPTNSAAERATEAEPAVASSAPAVVPTPTAGGADAAPQAGPRSKVPLVDVALFAQTRGAMSKFDTLVSFYLTDTEQYLRAIKEALAIGRIEDAILPAHTIKSSSRIVGALGLAHLAEEFEKRARMEGTSRVGELNALRSHMERLFGLTRRTIEQLMQEAARENAAA